jgi:hypothetical protein
VVATLKPLKGADVKSATDEIALVEGVAGLTSSATGLELHTDLEKLSMDNLKAAASKHNCEIIVNQTFEWVKYKLVEGDSWEYINAVDLIKGVMIVRDDGEGGVGMWINKSMVKVEQLEKIQGFKVERK